MTETPEPPVPWQFVGQPETYHMAVELYVNSVVARAQKRALATGYDRPMAADIVAVLRDDATALKRQHEERIKKEKS